MLLEPLLLVCHHHIDLSLIRNRLALLFLEITDVVSKEVIRDNESFLALGTFLARVRDTVGIVVILRGCADKDSLVLKFNQVVNVIWKLLQL